MNNSKVKKISLINNIIVAGLVSVFFIYLMNVGTFSVRARIWILMIAVGVVFTLFFFAKKYWTMPIDKLAFWLIMFWGFIVYLVLPVGTSTPDEIRHFRSVYEWSNQIFGVSTIDETIEAEDGNDYPQLTLRAEDGAFQNSYNSKKDESSNNYLTRAYEDNVYWGVIANSGEYEYVPSGYDILPWYKYIPAIIGVCIAKFLHLSLLFVRLFGCMFNLLFYALCTKFAIKIIPKGKTSLLLFSLLPTMMDQAKSFSYDAISNGVAVLFIALCAWMAYYPALVKWKHLVLATFMYCYLQLFKGIYIGFILLLLYALYYVYRFYKIGKKGETSKKDKILRIVVLSLVIIGVIIIMPFVIDKISIVLNSSSRIYNRETDTYSYLFSDIINHPKMMFTIFLNSILLAAHEIFMGNNCFPYLTDSGNGVVANGISALLIMFIARESKGRYNKDYRIISWMVLFSVVVCTILGCIFMWTPYKSENPWGMQSRYYLPVIALMLVAYGSSEVKTVRHYNYIYAMQIFLVFSIFCSMYIRIAF